MVRISIGFACILLLVMCLGLSLGLIPDQNGAIAMGRKNLCEALAIQSSVAIQQGDIAALQAGVRAIAKRNADIVSAGVRKTDGRLLVDSGRHAETWDADASDRPSATQMAVPIFIKNELWGNIEVRFRPPSMASAWGIGSFTGLTVFVVMSGFALGACYLKSVLRHIDPRQANIVPERVRATLNTIAEGVLVLDKDQRIALANDAFARTVGETSETLTGRKSPSFRGSSIRRQKRTISHGSKRCTKARRNSALFLSSTVRKGGRSPSMPRPSMPMTGLAKERWQLSTT